MTKNSWRKLGLQISDESFLLVLDELLLRHDLEEFQHHCIDFDSQFLIPIDKILGVEIRSLADLFFQLHDIHVKVTFNFNAEIERKQTDVVFGKIHAFSY